MFKLRFRARVIGFRAFWCKICFFQIRYLVTPPPSNGHHKDYCRFAKALITPYLRALISRGKENHMENDMEHLMRHVGIERGAIHDVSSRHRPNYTLHIRP